MDAPAAAIATTTEPDDRRTAGLARWTAQPPFGRDDKGVVHLNSYSLARAVLRAPESEQSGFGADIIRRSRTSLMRVPVIFLEGAEHQELRRATARFFAPRTVEESYRALMEREADRMVARLVRDGRGRLEVMAMDMSVTVAAEIAGLTEHAMPGMAQRIANFLSNPPVGERMSAGLVLRIALSQFKLLKFYLFDVRPNIALRRQAPRADVISHLLSLGYRDREILTECVIFGAAGMVTTREFIVVATMHLLDRPELRARFLAESEEGRRAILEEILRLEPVIGSLYRRVNASLDLPDGHRLESGQEVVMDLRSANADPDAVGACPFHLDPDRQIDAKVGRPAMGFGDGRHKCPGAFIAMQESAMLLARLLALPGLRIVGEPKVSWNKLVGSYEFHEVNVAV
jgi:cytochrome P450